MKFMRRLEIENDKVHLATEAKMAKKSVKLLNVLKSVSFFPETEIY